MSHHHPPETQSKLFQQVARMMTKWSLVLKENIVELLRPTATLEERLDAVQQISEVARQMEGVAIKADTATAVSKEH